MPEPRETTEKPIVYFDNIAAALLTSPRQVIVWATRKRDPLRLRVYHDIPRILPSKLQEWKRRHAKVATLRRVHGWNEIAKRVELSRMSAIRMAAREYDPLPVTQPKNGAMVWAYESALVDWREAQEVPYLAHRLLRQKRQTVEASRA
jgi:hypothetical protein